jgi:nucleoside-diphosphate-sugar epimerase
MRTERSGPIFVAGATGVLGVRLVPPLVDAVYTVATMTRSPEKAAGIRKLGAEPVVCDPCVMRLTIDPARPVHGTARAAPLRRRALDRLAANQRLDRFSHHVTTKTRRASMPTRPRAKLE